MSNRQARREQQRTVRQTRTTPPRGSGGQRKPSGPKRSGGGGPDLLSRPYLIGVSVLIVALAVILGIVMAMGGGSSNSDAVKKLQEERDNLPLDLANGTKLGKDDAPIKLTEFADYQCPFCLQFAAEQEPELIEKFVKTGKVQLIYRNNPILGKNGESVRAAVAGYCAADENKFWQYHNKLFTVQAEAGQSPSNERIDVGRFSDTNLKKYADEIGLDRTKFDSCLGSPDTLAKVTEDKRLADQNGITGTPGFLVNGQRLGTGTPANIDAWQQIFDAVLATPTAAPSGTAGANGTASPAATTSPAAGATAAPTASAQASPTR